MSEAPIRVAAFTGGESVPSARFRVRQYIDCLREHSVELAEYASPVGMYPPHSKWLRPGWGIASLTTRLPAIAASYKHDLTLLQRELLSTFATLEFLTKRPRVLDVDDAIWLQGGGTFAGKVARQCAGIICGNTFLAEHFGQWSSDVAVIPTGLDTDRFVPGAPTENLVIGWSGTSGGFKYLYGIERALAVVLQQIPGATLRIVCESMPVFREIPPSRTEFIRWSPGNEVQAVQGMSVGIMPLDDSLWARGKCSLKMLMYMACEVPVVVSPVGMNAEVLSHGSIGLGARTIDDWVGALSVLLQSTEQRRDMGRNGRRTVLDRYSVKVVAPRLAAKLVQFARANR